MRAASIALALIFAGSFALFAQDAEKKPDQPAPKQDAAAAERALQAKISRLVDGLAADSFKVRESSFDQLVAIGPPALPALEAAKKSEDPEVSAAASEAMAAIRARHRIAPPRSQEPPRAPQSEGEGLERAPLPQALPGREEMLEQLQKQFPEMKQLLERFQEGNSQLRLLDPNDPLFKDFFGGENPFGELFGEQEDQGQAPAPRTRSRVFTWSNVPQPSGPAGRLGLRLRSASPVLRSQLSIPEGQGLVVHQLAPRSFAATQGIQQYDLLLEANGKPIRGENDLIPVVAKGGQLTVLRQAKRQVLNLAPAPQQAAGPRPRILRRAPEAPKKPAEPAPKSDDQRDF